MALEWKRRMGDANERNMNNGKRQDSRLADRTAGRANYRYRATLIYHSSESRGGVCFLEDGERKRAKKVGKGRLGESFSLAT